jgi:hypothetical protein
LIRRRKASFVLAVTVGLFVAGQATVSSAGAVTTITTAPAGPIGSAANCFPFGSGNDVSEQWTPFMGFVYKNVPPFQLRIGDTVGFDLGGVNDADVQLDVAFAATTTNGGDVPAGGFTAVANNSQTPANPRGDTTAGNYELRFTAQAPFTFAGGGLIARFSNPSASYLLDTTCTPVAYRGINSMDASGFFVERVFADADGTAPWDKSGDDSIVPIQLTLAPHRKKCKKKKRKRSAEIAKKKCKKKKKRK